MIFRGGGGTSNKICFISFDKCMHVSISSHCFVLDFFVNNRQGLTTPMIGFLVLSLVGCCVT